MMRRFAVLLALAVAALPVCAQTLPAGPPGVPADAPARPRLTLDERFAIANTTHDGRLTLEQARSKLPAVAHRFAAIDTANQGYVTLDQIKAYRRQQAAERRAAKKAAQ